MEIYLLKSAACLALLMLFYKALLEKENMHIFKRYYLLAAVPVSVAIPLVTFTRYVETSPTLAEPEVFFLTTSASSEGIAAWIPSFLLGIYLVGVLFFGIKFVRNFRDLVQKIRKNPKVQNDSTTRVLLQENVPPHTFWTYIFLNRKKYEKKEIPNEVFEHEQAHARQLHSADVLLVELFQIVFWFYPVVYLLKQSIKLNHEFLADRAVLRKGVKRSSYQHTLLSFSSSGFQGDLVNPISYSSIKKRFTVMKTKTSKKAILLRTFLLAPLLLGLLYSFSTTETVEVIENSGHEIIQEEVTPEMIREYNKLAIYYNTYGLTRESVESAAFKRMKYIYSLMSPEQRKTAEAFPPPPPPSPVSEKGKEERRVDRTQDVPPPPPPPPPIEVIGHPARGSEKVKTSENKNLPPLPPPVEVIGHPAPPPPPPPPSPEESIKKLQKEGATFFFEGEKISGEEALRIVRTNDNLKVNITETNGVKKVEMYQAEDDDSTSATGSKSKYQNPMTRSETIEHLKELSNEGIVFRYEGKEISLEKALERLERGYITFRYSEEGPKKIMRIEDL